MRLITYLALSLLCVILSAALLLKGLLRKQVVPIQYITVILMTGSIMFMSTFSRYNIAAAKHGAYGYVQLSQTLKEIKSCTDNGFTESDNIPEDHDNMIIIFFKYGCPDCEAIHDELMEYINTHDIDIHFVSTRSEMGQNLLKEYPVYEIPAAVYVKTDKNGKKIVMKETLCLKSDTITLNTEGLSFLQSLQSENNP